MRIKVRLRLIMDLNYDEFWCCSLARRHNVFIGISGGANFTHNDAMGRASRQHQTGAVWQRHAEAAGICMQTTSFS